MLKGFILPDLDASTASCWAGARKVPPTAPVLHQQDGVCAASVSRESTLKMGGCTQKTSVSSEDMPPVRELGFGGGSHRSCSSSSCRCK